MTNYEILGVSENISEEELKKTYKYLCKQYHPDIFSGDEAFAEKKMKELNHAYNEILNEIKNKQFASEEKCHTESSAEEKTADSKSYQGKNYTYENTASSQSNINDVSSPSKKKMGCGGCLLRIIGISILLSVIGGIFGGTSTEEKPNTTVNETLATTTTASPSIPIAEDNDFSIGDCFYYGNFEQNNSLNDGKEKIEWIVLDIEDDKILAVSKYALNFLPYDDIDGWLTNDFLLNSFTTEEQEKMVTVTHFVGHDIDNDEDVYKREKVFLLSADEAEKYFADDTARLCNITEYSLSVADGWIITDNWIKNQMLDYYEENRMSAYKNCCWWWLRKHDEILSSYNYPYVYAEGDIVLTDSVDKSHSFGIRPAMYLSTDEAYSDSVEVQKYNEQVKAEAERIPNKATDLIGSRLDKIISFFGENYEYKQFPDYEYYFLSNSLAELRPTDKAIKYGEYGHSILLGYSVTTTNEKIYSVLLESGNPITDSIDGTLNVNMSFSDIENLIPGVELTYDDFYDEYYTNIYCDTEEDGVADLIYHFRFNSNDTSSPCEYVEIISGFDGQQVPKPTITSQATSITTNIATVETEFPTISESTIATSVENTTNPIVTYNFTERNTKLYRCISILAYQADIAIEYHYRDSDGNNLKEVIGDSYNYDEAFPYYVNGDSCYVEDGCYFIPLYYYMGTNCGTYIVIPEEDLALTEEDYYALKNFNENYDENAATIEITVKNRVFGADTSGRKVDIYFDGEKIGTVKGSAILITQEETFTINTTVGTHTIEFKADALFAKDMYSKYKITVSNLGAYMEIRLSDNGTHIDADFDNLLDDYIMMDGMYYIEEVYDY